MGTFTTNDTGKKAVCTNNINGIAKGDILTIEHVLMSFELLIFKEMPNSQIHWSYFELFTPTLLAIVNGRLVALQEKPPACIDCEHMEGELIRPQCGRANMFYDIVLGITYSISPRSCRYERQSEDKLRCGINAQYFESKTNED